MNHGCGVQAIPRDNQGRYTLPSGTTVSSGETILVSQHNPAFADVAQSLTNSLDRNGRGGMLAPLDMGGYSIENIAPGTGPNDVATVSQIAPPPDTADTTKQNQAAKGTGDSFASVLLVGDSFGQGGNASTYRNSWPWLVARALLNQANKGLYSGQQGDGYHAILNMYDFGLAYPGAGTTGALVAHGIWGHGAGDPQGRITLGSGQSFTTSGYKAAAIQVIYDASASTGNLTLSLNGTVFQTVAMTGTGLKATPLVFFKGNGHLIKLSDTISVSASGGSVELVSIIPHKASQNQGVSVYVGARAGYAYQDYSSTAALDEMAFYLNLNAPGKRTGVFNLGTNNLYNADKALTPADMVAQMEIVRAGLTARVPGFRMVVAVPPKSNEAVFPLIKSGYVFADYVAAILPWCQANHVTAVRQDLSPLSTGAYYAEGLHPNDAGHAIYTATLLEALAVPYDTQIQSSEALETEYLGQMRADAVLTYTAPWTDYNATNKISVSRVAGRVLLGGLVAANGATAGVIGTLPLGFRPAGRDRVLACSGGITGTPATVPVRVSTTGAITVLAATMPPDVDLSGVCFDIEPVL